MGISVGVMLLVGAAAGASAAVGEMNRKSASKEAANAKNAAAANKNKLTVTPEGLSNKNARTALIVGSPKGTLSAEDESATSGRGRILGN